MFKLEKLKHYQVHVVDQATERMSLTDSLTERHNVLIQTIMQKNETPNQAVATSIFMRRYGFFIASLFYLKAHNKMWDGPPDKIFLYPIDDSFSFQVEAHYIREAQEGDVALIIKKYGQVVVDTMSEKGKISKVTLWENIWGYVLWMYSQTKTRQAALDLDKLLEDRVWQPEMRKSMFAQFLRGRTVQEAQVEFKRVTCCLYKELPNMDACPYCPLNHSK